ncbi:MAG: hypothetical protein IJ940_04605 [Bacteroidales bacterium]|nr:hypothetical protein [Bacteroidales bacterium]
MKGQAGVNPGKDFRHLGFPFFMFRIMGNHGVVMHYQMDSVLFQTRPLYGINNVKSAGFAVVEHTPMTFGICRMYVGKKATI